MKKFTVILVMILCLFCTSSVIAQEEQPPGPVVQQCKKTLMTENCFSCHSTPSFKIKEADPFESLIPPNSSTEFQFIRGELIGVFYLNSITPYSIRNALIYFESHGTKRVIIDISSYGGSLLDAFHIVSLIEEFQNKGIKIDTKCYGYAMSAGALIFIAGEDRIVSNHAHIMWHELSIGKMFAIETPSKSKDEAKELEMMQLVANSYFSERTGIDIKEIETNIAYKDWYMSGREALKNGVATKLLD